MKEKLRIGASSRFHTKHPKGSFTVTEMIEHFHRVGFQGIDFDIETVPGMGADWKRIIGGAAELAAKYDILMDYGHLPFKKIKVNGREDKEQFKKNMLLSIEAAGFAGIKHAVIHPIGALDALPEDAEKTFQKNIEYHTPFVEHAIKHGVKLAFENMRSPLEKEGHHRFGSTAAEILRLSEYFDMENCWDFGHANTTGLVQSEELRLLKGRLTVLHVNDNHAGDDEHLMPFLGTIDWIDAMKGLSAAEYKGVFNFETKTFRMPLEVRDEIARYCLRVGEYLTGLLAD